MSKTAKRVSSDTASGWLWELRRMTYNSGIGVEERWLHMIGTPGRERDQLIAEWRGAFDRWWDAMRDPSRNGCVAGWGAAAEAAVHPVVEQFIDLIADELVPEPRGASVTHGSSITGYMGRFDRAWSRRIKLENSSGGGTRAEIITIPLRWIAEDVREIPAKSGDKKFRCPPHLLVSDRTELFGLCKPKMFIIAPGGLGTRFELYWALLAAQLRHMLLTCFTGIETALPEIFLLDHQLKMGRQTVWACDGFLLDTKIQVFGKTIKQEHINHVTVLRCGSGPNLTSRKRRGFAVRHFRKPESLASYVGERYDAIASI